MNFSLIDFKNVFGILNKIAIFGGLNEKQLYAVLKVLKKTSCQKDEVIFKQGESPSHIYIVQSGRIKLYLHAEGISYELIEFGVGDCFGETALIGIQPHTANAVAMEETDLIVLSGHALFSLHETERDVFSLIVLNIAREVSRRLSKADNIMLHYVLNKK